MRIAVPDFEAITTEYNCNHRFSDLIGLLYGGQTYEYNYHNMGYDFDYLKDKLSNAGFCNIKRYDWRDFLPEGYDDFSRAYLPHMDFENGRLMSLNVICEKENKIQLCAKDSFNE